MVSSLCLIARAAASASALVRGLGRTESIANSSLLFLGSINVAKGRTSLSAVLLGGEASHDDRAFRMIWRL